MSAVGRGTKNAFRSALRSTAVIVILAISMGLGLSMLLANHAVKDRLQSVRQEVGTTIAVNPAGARGFQGGGEPLTTDDMAKVKAVAHVASVDEVLNLTVQTTGTSQNGFMAFGGRKSGETSLESSIDPGTLGRRFEQRSGGAVVGGDTAAPADITLPIRMTGITGSRTEDGTTIKLTEGRQLAAGDGTVAVVGKNLATKNNLTLGSTFTAYDETFTVVGIFDTGTEFGNDGLYVPLATAQRVSESDTEISNAIVKVDSVENLEATVKNIQTALGTDKADVTATEESAMTAVSSLQTVERVSLIGFVIALIAAAVIILLTMLMIVRERRREIGVLKAIGAGTRTIVSQFVAEALVLVLVGAVVGLGVAALSGNRIAGALVSSNTQTQSSDSGPRLGGQDGPVRGGAFRTFRFGAQQQSAEAVVGEVSITVGLDTVAYGLAAAIVIAVVGSALPAYMIAKVRPAEVLRSE